MDFFDGGHFTASFKMAFLVNSDLIHEIECQWNSRRMEIWLMACLLQSWQNLAQSVFSPPILHRRRHAMLF